MLHPVILFRESLAEEEELKAAAKYFPIVTRRTAIPAGSLVIPRYSALPFNQELEEDIIALGSKLINSHAEHVYVADLQNWYNNLEGLTPKTWFRLDQIPDRGPFVLKGATNSKKDQWKKFMFAADKKEAIEVFLRLTRDGYIGYQSIYIREYVSLHKVCDPLSVDSIPISEEYRFFVLNGEILAKGFYWSQYLDQVDSSKINPDFVPKEFLESVISKVKDYIPFFVVDVARTATGEWIVVELNDGQQSGLSAINPNDLYSSLYYSSLRSFAKV
jgi:hypothetical protein